MRIRIKKRGGLTGFQLGLATVLGVLGGIYIYQPLFKPQEPTIEQKDQKDE